MAIDAAEAITACDGRGILWVLDGWDELPSHLRESSILRNLIFPPTESPVSLSSVIITSRPISSGDLCEVVSSRIEVLGFTREEQRHFFTECLKGDIKAVDDLVERLGENPGIEGSCYLPLNASIVAHVYLSDGFVPNTVYGMFSSLIQHFLSRYLCERLGKTREEARFQSLSSLPPELQAPFSHLCEIAFKGSSKNKVTFSERDFEAVNDLKVLHELGLLKATQSLIINGQQVYYNFVHVSVQEVLTAIYISRLPASEQIATFDTLLGDSRLGPVLQYYAAITKLRTSRPWLSKLPSWLIPNRINVHMLDLVRKIIVQNSKPLLVSLFHCLYEAQDPSLCQFVAEQLNSQLLLYDISLTPIDSLAIGYFLSSTTPTKTMKEFTVYLISCSLGDASTKSLMCSIGRHANADSTPINMRLDHNKIGKEGASHIAEILTNTNIVNRLWLTGNPIGDEGLQPIFSTLKNSNAVRLLCVAICGMTDIGITSLAEAMEVNTTLERLYIHGNDALSDNGLTCLVEALSKHSRLETLWIPGHLKVDAVRKAINEARTTNRLEAVEVKCEYTYQIGISISWYIVIVVL